MIPNFRYTGVRFTTLLLLFFCSCLQASEPLKAWAYVSAWMGEGWRTANIQQLDRLLFFEIKIGKEGLVVENNGWPERWQDLVDSATKSQVPLDLTLTMFSVEDFNALFLKKAARKAFVDQTVQLARSSGVSGIHLDFEIYKGSNAAALEHYRRTVRELAAQLAELTPSRSLSVFFPMGGEAELYDAITLRSLNAVVFQGYDAHWADGPTAGPLSPLRGSEAATWEKILLQVAKNQIETSRTLISFPLYGYEWPVKGPSLRSDTIGKARITTFAPVARNLLPDIQLNVVGQVAHHGMHYDPESSSSYYKFSPQPGEWVEGWFEDWWSLGRKIEFLKEGKIGGVAFFPLGYDAGRLVDYYYRNRNTDTNLDGDYQ